MFLAINIVTTNKIKLGWQKNFKIFLVCYVEKMYFSLSPILDMYEKILRNERLFDTLRKYHMKWFSFDLINFFMNSSLKH